MSTVLTGARLPINIRKTQHPLSDSWFSHVRSILEACSIDSGGCEECDLRSGCTRIFDSLAERCSDIQLDAHDYLLFTIKFCELILGEKITVKDINTKKNSTNNFSVLVNGTPVYICSRCNYTWISRLAKLPPQCPNCHSGYWHKPKRNGNS